MTPERASAISRLERLRLVAFVAESRPEIADVAVRGDGSVAIWLSREALELIGYNEQVDRARWVPDINAAISLLRAFDEPVDTMEASDV